MGVPGSEKSRPLRSSIRRRALSTSGASRRRMPTLSRVCGIAGVGEVHVGPLVLGHHLQRELVVVAQEQRPLAAGRDGRRAAEDVDDGLGALQAQPHEDPGHERKVERHVAFVALPEVGAHVRRPLVGLGEKQAARRPLVHERPQAADDRVRLGKVLAARSLPLHQVGDRVQPEAVHPQVEPEAHRGLDLLEHARVVEVEVRLVAEEAVPVVGLRLRVPGPVGPLGVGEDDAGALRIDGRCRSRRSSRARVIRAATGAPAETRGAGRRCGSPPARSAR